MDDVTEFKYKSKVTEILPNTKRTQELREKKQKEAEKKLQEQENKKKKQQEQQQKQQMQFEKQEQKRKQDEQRKKEELRKQQEELQEINTLKGRFGNMINNLSNNQTPLEYTITGLSLLDAQIRILVQVTLQNMTLKSLVMVRKNIKEKEGVQIAKSLKDNQVLEKIELEGNHLGVETVKEFGHLLQFNRVLRSLDLENNDLTQGYTNSKGIASLAEGLKVNRTLLCLNLNNTQLNEECGQLLREALKYNRTLISLDIEQNNKLHFEDVRAIQEQLIRNKEAYDQERLAEFLERKRMRREEDISSILLSKQEAQQLTKDSINQRIENKRMQMEEEWKQKLLEEQAQKEKMMVKLMREAEQRKKKKKKKRK